MNNKDRLLLVGTCFGGLLIGYLSFLYMQWWAVGYLEILNLTVSEVMNLNPWWVIGHTQLFMCWLVYCFPEIALALYFSISTLTLLCIVGVVLK